MIPLLRQAARTSAFRGPSVAFERSTMAPAALATVGLRSSTNQAVQEQEPLSSIMTSGHHWHPTVGANHLADLDPEEIFNSIDTNKDGTISKQEFMVAMEKIHFAELFHVYQTADANLKALEKKMAAVKRIESDLVDLEGYSRQHQHAYSVVGLMTDAEIEALFAQSMSKKKDIQASLEDLHDLINEARNLFQGPEAA